MENPKPIPSFPLRPRPILPPLALLASAERVRENIEIAGEPGRERDSVL